MQCFFCVVFFFSFVDDFAASLLIWSWFANTILAKVYLEYALLSGWFWCQKLSPMIDVPFSNLQNLNMRVNTRQQVFAPLLVCRWVFDHGSLLLLLASLKHSNIAWIARPHISRLSAYIFIRAICYWFDALFSVVYFELNGGLVWRHSSFAFFDFFLENPEIVGSALLTPLCFWSQFLVLHRFRGQSVQLGVPVVERSLHSSHPLGVRCFCVSLKVRLIWAVQWWVGQLCLIILGSHS